MSSGDAPPSFSSTRKNGYDQDEFQPAGDDYIKNPLPSLGSMGHGQGNSQNHFENDQSTVKTPSLSDFGHTTRNSYVDGNTNRELGDFYYGQPPSVGAMVKVAVSHASDGVDDPYNAPKGPPGLSDVNQRAPSQNGISSDQDIVMVDDPSLVGISLVGPNFRKLYPNAYYKESN